MEKNVIVTDELGKQIGTTYPKRAKGLVKNGRAEYADDRTIRLKDTRIPTVELFTEEVNMSKTINFSARDFKLEDTCNSNVGVRGFMTIGGESTEVWEIGDWNWNWTSLSRDVTGLEKNTDYIFRFAMTGGHSDDDKEVSMVNITHLGATDSQYQFDNEEEQARAWDERYTYCIGESRFEPVISKRDKTGMLRIFELPFNTGEHENWRIIIIAQHAVARFFAPKDNEFYAELEDLPFEQWRKERTEQIREERMRDAAAMAGANYDWDSQSEDPQSVRGDAFQESIPNFFGGRIDLAEAEIHSAKMLRELISLAKRGVHVDLSGAIIDCDEDED